MLAHRTFALFHGAITRAACAFALASSSSHAVCAQFLSRDPGFAPPQSVGLKDAFSFTVLP